MTPTTKPAPKTFQAVCDTCYTCVIASGKKRACERAATSHISAYQHTVSILVKAVR